MIGNTSNRLDEQFLSRQRRAWHNNMHMSRDNKHNINRGKDILQLHCNNDSYLW